MLWSLVLSRGGSWTRLDLLHHEIAISTMSREVLAIRVCLLLGFVAAQCDGQAVGSRGLQPPVLGVIPFCGPCPRHDSLSKPPPGLRGQPPRTPAARLRRADWCETRISHPSPTAVLSHAATDVVGRFLPTAIRADTVKPQSRLAHPAFSVRQGKRHPCTRWARLRARTRQRSPRTGGTSRPPDTRTPAGCHVDSPTSATGCV